MEAGDIIDKTCIRSVRPGYGLAPKYFDSILGKNVIKNIVKNSAVQLDAIR